MTPSRTPSGAPAASTRAASRPATAGPIGVYVLLVLLIIAYAWALAPVAFTSFDLASIVIGALPLVFAAMAQAVIVISGGIDLSLGVIVAVINVSAASLMEGQSFATALLIAFGLMLLGALIGAINGGLCVVSGVPDIVVTLAMSFVWGGTALVIMRTPGGGAPTEFQSLGTGSFITMWIPAGAVIIALVAAAVWVPLRWRAAGLRDLRDRLQSRPRVPVRRQRRVDARAGLRGRRLLRRDGRPRRDRDDGHRHAVRAATSSR